MMLNFLTRLKIESNSNSQQGLKGLEADLIYFLPFIYSFFPYSHTTNKGFDKIFDSSFFKDQKNEI